MQDDLVTTAAAAEMLGKSVATINRWAVEDVLKPAFTIPGKKGARLYHLADVEALLAQPEDAA